MMSISPAEVCGSSGIDASSTVIIHFDGNMMMILSPGSIYPTALATNVECVLAEKFPDIPSFTATGTRTAQTRGTAPKANFIIFLAGDPECYDIGAWGATDLKAPNIDALSTFRSTLHELVCCRPGLRTLLRSIADGRYRIRAGVPGNGQTLRPGERTIAATLKPAGYSTGIFGKWHQGSTPDTVPIAPGFDRFTGFHAGCIDYYYSHRYYWGEPRAVNYHDLWRYRTEDGQHSTELLAR